MNICSQNVPLSGVIIQEEASSYAKELNIENFIASDSWLRRWKEWRNITFKKISGESNSVTPEMVNACKEISLPFLLFSYDWKDVHNDDKFGLFCKCMTNKTCQLKSERCSGGKLSKVRITDKAVANAVGNKIPMFVIGKTQKSCCFKNVKFLPCRYRHKNGWRTVWRVGERIRPKIFIRRSVTLVIDNCPAHPK